MGGIPMSQDCDNSKVMKSFVSSNERFWYAKNRMNYAIFG
jgi:hypothetical protein